MADDDGDDSDVVADWDLRNVSTQWSRIDDIDVFVLRYVDPIRAYLERLIDADAVDDVLQQFLVKVLERGFRTVSPDRGRFRHYLIRAVRNEVATWHRVNSRSLTSELGERDVEDRAEDDVDNVWLMSWRDTVISRARAVVDEYETEHAGCLYGTVLTLASTRVELSSEEISDELSQSTGRSVSPAAYRQQLRRARRMLAHAIIREVAETLDEPSQAAVQSELAEIGLWAMIRDYVPSDWGSPTATD